MYNVYVTRIKNVRKHPMADRLQLGECFGNTVCVSLDYENNQLGVYFPTDGQVSVEFAEKNNLLRKKDEQGNNIGGYMDPSKRNVTTIKLRGEKSDGLFLPLECLKDFGDITSLKEGDIVSVFNGHEIARKYIPVRKNKQGKIIEGNKTRHKKVNLAPLFMEHADTEQLAYNLSAFKLDDEIEVTLKMHGTSQRTAYLPVLKRYKRSILDRISRKEGRLIYEYDYVTGTRRTVLENYDGDFYGDNAFRKQHHNKFVGKLMKGETVYYEVVGFTDNGTPIMGNGKNEKLGKDFVKRYGKETVFSYGCDCAEQAAKEKREQDIDKPQSDIYVYRMTMTNEDGFVVEYSPDFMRYRCEQMGVKCVPLFYKDIINTRNLHLYGFTNEQVGEFVKTIAEKFYDGTDPIGKTHIKEGVVVRIINRPKFNAYKHKNFEFKMLSNIIVDELSKNNEIENISNDIIEEF